LWFKNQVAGRVNHLFDLMLFLAFEGRHGVTAIVLAAIIFYKPYTRSGIDAF
jgi:hypothetical protein